MPEHLYLPAALAALALAACQSTTGADQAVRTLDASSVATESMGSLGATVASLASAAKVLGDTVETKGFINREKVAAGDIGTAFDTYGDALAGVQKAGKDVHRRVEGLDASMERYLETWRKESAKLTNEDLRAAGEKRREEARTNYDEARAEVQEALDRFDEYARHAEEIETALSNDLTPEGIASIAGPLKKVTSQAGPVAERLEDAAEDLTQFAASLRTRK